MEAESSLGFTPSYDKFWSSKLYWRLIFNWKVEERRLEKY